MRSAPCILALIVDATTATRQHCNWATPHALAFRVPEECSETVAQLIDSCLLDDPDQRPTARDLVHKLGKAAQEGASGARPRSKRSSVVSMSSPVAQWCPSRTKPWSEQMPCVLMIEKRGSYGAPILLERRKLVWLRLPAWP